MAEDSKAEERKTPPLPKGAAYLPAFKPNVDYPLIDNDPHFFRVLRYARSSDYAWGAGVAAVPPAFMLATERVSPSFAGKGAFPPIMRLNVAVGLCAGFLFFYQRSTYRFYGVTENKREVDMDMREMVDKVKKGQPLYGQSDLTDHMQGVAARNSRYSGAFLHVVPMFNFVNHNQHGIDTAKYYQQAERELEQAQQGKGSA